MLVLLSDIVEADIGFFMLKQQVGIRPKGILDIFWTNLMYYLVYKVEKNSNKY